MSAPGKHSYEVGERAWIKVDAFSPLQEVIVEELLPEGLPGGPLVQEGNPTGRGYVVRKVGVQDAPMTIRYAGNMSDAPDQPLQYIRDLLALQAEQPVTLPAGGNPGGQVSGCEGCGCGGCDQKTAANPSQIV